MKTRSGFVSNSSSSSFIVHDTINAVAPAMLDIVIQDWDKWNDASIGSEQISDSRKEYAKWETNLAKALKKTDVISGKIGIVQPSTNEDTYIVFRNGICYVQTCRNHDWDGLRGMGTNYGEETNPELSGIIDSAYFYDVRNNAIRSVTRYDHAGLIPPICPKCKDENYSAYCLDRKGNTICASCGKRFGSRNYPKPQKSEKPEKSEVRVFHSPISDLEVD